jgi:hypothetical protein
MLHIYVQYEVTAASIERQQCNSYVGDLFHAICENHVESVSKQQIFITSY